MNFSKGEADKIGLVLEGGGMRGLYTSGVLDFFMEENLFFPYVIGVSAGACNALSYISRQKGRNREININYANDPRYINLKNLFLGKGIFGMDFIFNDIPNHLLPFEYDKFNQAKERFVVPTTDCISGETVYFEKNICRDLFTAVKASSSMPIASKMVIMEGKFLLDGGISDPIPVLKSMQDGNSRNVIILTRDEGYRKKPSRARYITNILYSRYEELAKAIEDRYKVYNQTLDYIEEAENEGRFFVIRPQKPVKIKRIERNPIKLQELYEAGYNDAKANYEELSRWLKMATSETR